MKQKIFSVNYILWEVSVRGWMKWNVDVFFDVESGGAAIGGVLRDWSFYIRCLFLMKVEAYEINEAEVLVIFLVIELLFEKV